MSISRAQKENASCAYWDEEAHRWSLEGVRTLRTEQGYLSCETTHLSIFGAVVVPPLLFQDSIYIYIDDVYI